MKEKFVSILSITVIALTFIALVGIAGYMETHYTKECVVVDVVGDSVTVVDNQGEEWQFFGDNYHKGDVLGVTFDENDTQSIFNDDIIVKTKVKYNLVDKKGEK